MTRSPGCLVGRAPWMSVRLALTQACDAEGNGNGNGNGNGWQAWRTGAVCVAGRLACHLVALLLAAALLMTWGSPVWAIGPDWQLPAGSTQAIDTQRIWLFGRQASLKTFETPANIADVALALIAQVSTPPQLQAMPDGMLMAGMTGEVHWLVRLVASAETRTQGSASAIDLRRAPSLPALAWQPAGMSVRLDLATREDTGLVRQQVLSDARPVAVVYQRLCSALLRHGWRPDLTAATKDMAVEHCGARPIAWPASSFWQRDGATLMLVIDGDRAGSAIFVLQADPPSPGWRGWPERLAGWLGRAGIGPPGSGHAEPGLTGSGDPAAGSAGAGHPGVGHMRLGHTPHGDSR